MADVEIENITIAAFIAMSEAEQRAFVIGVANGRGMTSGLFRAYAGAASKIAATSTERESITMNFEKIDSMVTPLLTIDVVSLLNGIRIACERQEDREAFIINAIASVHLGVAKAMKERYEQSGDTSFS